MNCDNCIHYVWYYDFCREWNCVVDPREVYNCFEPCGTKIRETMVNFKEKVEGLE